MQAKEKSWYFDPLTERAAALAANPDAVYLLLEATPKDKQKIVWLYEECSVSGYEVAGVEVIYNRDFNVTFQTYLKQQQRKKGNSAFAPEWSSMSHPALRQEIHGVLARKAQPYQDSDYPDVTILPAWHGTKPEALDGIFSIGYSNLAFTDSGFFGKGLYSTFEAEYAYRVYSKGALILNWVACFSALPVVKDDMSSLKGKANRGNYDAHFVPVVPQDPLSSNEKNYFPCKSRYQAQYHEIVVFQTAACLPRFLVKLQPTLPKRLYLPPTQTEPLLALPSTSVIGTAQNFFKGSEDLAQSFSKAKMYIEHKNSAKALPYLNVLVDAEPKNSDYRFWRGICLSYLKRISEALTDFDLAIKYNPKHAQSWVERGYIYEKQGKMRQALQDYTDALKRDPRHYFALCQRGGILMQQNEIASGEADFRQAAFIKNDDPILYRNRGTQYLFLKCYPEAIADFDRVLALRPDWTDIQAMKQEAQNLQQQQLATEMLEDRENCRLM